MGKGVQHCWTFQQVHLKLARYILHSLSHVRGKYQCSICKYYNYKSLQEKKLSKGSVTIICA